MEINGAVEGTLGVGLVYHDEVRGAFAVPSQPFLCRIGSRSPMLIAVHHALLSDVYHEAAFVCYMISINKLFSNVSAQIEAHYRN